MCKIPEVQGPLATIRGWKSFGDTVPVLLVAIPIGNLGDRYGRRKIMALSLIGVGLSLVEIFVVCAYPKIFDLRWVWLSSLFLLCGGGLYSSAAFMWAMASSLISEDKRSYAFYYIFSAFYIAELIGSYVASITIDISPWIACSMAMGSVILGLLLLWLVPFSQPSPPPEVLSQPISSSSSSTRLHLTTTSKTTILATIRRAVIQPNVLLCIPVFLVGTLRYTTLNVLIQYSSVRFGTKISKGAMFYTETAIINIFLFLFLIPRTTVWIKSRYHVRSEKIDLALMRISVCFLLMGSLAIGLAATSGWIPVGVSIFAAGFGSRVSTLSLISHFIPASSLATLYASIAVLENLGHAINDPSMQYIFAATLRLPPVWHALPFFVAAVSTLLIIKFAYKDKI
ncbi:putative alternative oxidase protein [Botrytis fragariae]|uniref:Putative alternative oxidase protein n=1 Tax=Botrytis fragariae TaxID=1964551 RepID=A0A8H6ASC8_9HELO|nr:putative alternative oxidase protein [Botrytis fragariae]KAF5872683.1 putative alternative oxidase protein [Botrytis fragariae]